jgi:hypothetical protein
MPIPNTYVKINKIDHNGVNNDIALGQATKLKIKYTTEPNYLTIGNILTKTEYPTYWLYKVQSLGSNTADNYIKDYKFSGSITNAIPNVFLPYFPIGLKFTESIDNADVYTSSSGLFMYNQTPNVAIKYTANFSASLNTVDPEEEAELNFYFGNTFLGQQLYTSSTSPFTTFSGSIYPLPYLNPTGSGVPPGYYEPGEPGFNIQINDPYFNFTVHSVQLSLTQSIAPTASVSCSVIIEPYITEPNFYNSDDNAVINLVNEQRENSFALDVDYGYGITPINFGLLVSGSGTSATVPDSNYTSKKSTILKYDGSKSTSQLLNQWTQGDTGTYGKLPTIESLKTVIAYCDWIGGWPPEKENASAMNVLYLIKADGTVVIPNTSEDSLSIMQQTFQTGERVFISTKNSSISSTSPYRTIIRGGSHLEPILYTQFGQLPGVTWNTTMSFEDIVLSPGGNVGNYAAIFNRNTNQQIVSSNTPTKILFTSATQGNSYFVSNGYQVTSSAVQDGVDLIFNPVINFLGLKDSNADPQLLSNNFTFNITLKLYKGTQLINTSNTISSTTPILTNSVTGIISFQSPITIPAANLNTGDQYFIYIEWNGNYPTDSLFYVTSNSTFPIQQYPIFTLPVTSSGANSIWNWGNKTTYPYIITSSQTTLTQLYGDPNAKAKDISGSGFNSIQLPWSIKIGDEFKFEGREDFAYMVKNVYGAADSGSGRVFQTGSLEVHFNANLPVSASSSVFNLDHFLIRRYVDDAAQNIITGFRPPGSEGPYLIKPEFVVPELNKNIDEVILDLTQKGLIT